MSTILLYTSVLQQLNETVLRMTSAEFDELMHAGEVQERQRAARELLNVQQARLVLGNAVLAEIAEKLKANEQALIDGRESLEEALERLENIEKVLGTIGSFVKIVGRIVTLV